MERLSDRFGDIEGSDLAEALKQTANHAVEDNLPDYLAQLKDYTQDSFLEELDDLNTEVTYRRLTANSVAYMLMEWVQRVNNIRACAVEIVNSEIIFE